MRCYIDKKIIIGCILLFTALFSFSGICFAEKITDSTEIPYWEYTYFQSMVTQVSPDMDYIVTSKRKVYLVEAQYNDEILSTSVGDDKGGVIDLSAIKPGKWVFVWGAVLGDHSIGAKDIIVLPHELTGNDLGNLDAYKNKKKFIYHKH